jgi:hypothetical protein
MTTSYKNPLETFITTSLNTLVKPFKNSKNPQKTHKTLKKPFTNSKNN